MLPPLGLRPRWVQRTQWRGVALPSGRYTAEIVSATVAPYKSGKGQGVKLSWCIAEEEYEGRYVFDQITIQHESADAQKFGRQKFFKSAGFRSSRRGGRRSCTALRSSAAKDAFLKPDPHPAERWIAASGTMPFAIGDKKPRYSLAVLFRSPGLPNSNNTRSHRRSGSRSPAFASSMILSAIFASENLS
jgi:hypothetical protein